MASIFSYRFLNVDLDSSNKSITLEINNPLIGAQTILELEHFFLWLCKHIEVNSILITGSGNAFSHGFNLEEFAESPNSEIQLLWQKFQKIVYMCFFLPQTIIFDLKESAKGAGVEFSIGGDIRIAKEGAEIKFDHLKNGLIPNCGAIGFLDCIISQSFIRNWIVFGEKIPKEQLISSGLIHSFYDESNKNHGKNLISQISKIPQIARIQAKRSLLEPLISKLEKSLVFENEFALATLNINDWRKILSKEGDKLCSPKELSALLEKEFKAIN